MEKLYQYLWKHRMFGREMSVDGLRVRILSPGVLNNGAGPDFQAARLLVGDTVWAGNIEIHVKASDWFRHHHDTDPAYDNVILHVVAIDDMKVRRRDGSLIPQILVTFPEKFFHIYSSLADNINSVRCASYLKTLPDLAVTDWVETLTVERMQTKAMRIIETARQAGGDWEQACFITLARALGFGINSVPFEMTARSLPLKYIRRHGDNLLQIEALLFGQAGMLDTSIHIFDEYYQLLCREYFFLARKYGLRPLRNDIWKYARTRPQNFPHRRIAVLARALYRDFSIIGDLLAFQGDEEALRDLFRWKLEGYWLTHSDFDVETHGVAETLGAASLDLLLINFASPFIYAYSGEHGNPEKAERAFDIWHGLAPERNMFMRQWEAAGIKCRDAGQSQALLHLRREYCDKNRCLECRWGCFMLRDTVTPHSRMLGKVNGL